MSGSLKKYPEFAEFYRKRKEAPPWDHENNLLGFPKEIPNKSSDISAHLPLLQMLASQVYRCTEFGTRTCFSTSALIAGCRGFVTSYDLHDNPEINYLVHLNSRNKLPCTYEFIQGNTLHVKPIEYCELLFIDSLHTYNQVKVELERHAHKVNRYLVFHDTFSQWNFSIDRQGEEGIGRAIEEFMQANRKWKEVFRTPINHGLLVLENKDD